MSAIDALSAIDAPYAPLTPEDDALFDAAMREADAWHRARNPRYAALWQDDTRPLVPVSLLKHHDLGTPVDAPGLWLGSSGTTSGVQTRVYFDAPSLARIERAMVRMFLHHGLIDTRPARFLLLAPDPASGAHAGYATTFLKFTACAPVAECVFAVDAQHRLDAGAAWATLARWAPDDAPIYLFGLTVFFEQLALAAPAPFEFAGSVHGLTGGGWKGMVKQLERAAILARLAQAMRAARVDIRDLFGLTEHPLHYIGCPQGHFHVPRYSRFEIVAPDGTAARDGEPGLIRLQNPFFAALPTHDLLTGDIGLRGTACPCGEPLPYLRFIGRASVPDGTCAHEASRG